MHTHRHTPHKFPCVLDPKLTRHLPKAAGPQTWGAGGQPRRVGMGSEELARGKHAQYVVKLHSDAAAYEWVASEYLRMSGIYWGATALALLGRLDALDR